VIAVLRLGHRPERDKRVTTHVALVARAFGAEKLYYSGVRDDHFEASVKRVVEQWGGPFEVEFVKSWRKLIETFPGKRVHLTMYGEDKRVRGDQLVIVGGEKVPSEVYHLADLNVAIGNQPHSEVAALAVYLNDVSGLRKSFDNARLSIEPCARGKKVNEKAV
jgi:tRNA (cytidine56-2'-O)-methyltransferase